MTEQWFAGHRPEIPIVPLAGDVKDTRRMAHVFAKHQPQDVFHAAAYKHVPLMEVGNAWHAVRTNVLGTLVVVQTAQQAGAEIFLLISTVKAQYPPNVMGATRHQAETV